MNQFPVPPGWPAQVALDHAADRHVQADDGGVFELEAFRNACHLRAAELRGDAIDHLAASAFAGFPELQAACTHVLRLAAATFAHPRERSSS